MTMSNNPSGIRVYAYVEETKPDGEKVMHGQVLLTDKMPDIDHGSSLICILQEHMQCVERMYKPVQL